MGDVETLGTERRARHLLEGGTIAGLVGGLVLTVLGMLVSAVRGQSLWVGMKFAAYPFLRERVLAPAFDAPAVLLGLLCHFAVSVVWGILFALIAYGMSRRATLVFGAIWGVVVWMGMFFIVLPMVGMGALARGAPVGMWIVQHVIFGLGVALGFLPYQRTLPGWPGRRGLWRREAPAGSRP